MSIANLIGFDTDGKSKYSILILPQVSGQMDKAFCGTALVFHTSTVEHMDHNKFYIVQRSVINYHKHALEPIQWSSARPWRRTSHAACHQVLPPERGTQCPPPTVSSLCTVWRLQLFIVVECLPTDKQHTLQNREKPCSQCTTDVTITSKWNLLI